MKEIVERLTANNETISTMESCTGGEIVNEITNIAGASEILKFSAITYSNEYKIKMGVSSSIIDKFSVYSIQVADEMAKCISSYANADYGVGITGKLNRVDKFNLCGEDNIVFVSIYSKKEDRCYNATVECIKESRIENKKLVSNTVIYLLKNIIK